MPLAELRAHWESYNDASRDWKLALLSGAEAIAKLKGWKIDA